MGGKKDDYGWWLTTDGTCGSCNHFETRGAGAGWCHKHGKGSFLSTSPVWVRSCWMPDEELKAKQREQIALTEARHAEAERRSMARKAEIARVRAERLAAAAILRLEQVERKQAAKSARAQRKQEKAERKATRKAGK